MLNFEKGPELNRLNVEQNIKKIVESGGVNHTPMNHFKNLEKYNSKEIEKDKKTLDNAKKKFESYKQEMTKEEEERFEKSRERGEALEITLTYLLERWFETEDLEVMTQRTTEFDDIVNGTDLIVEFKTPDSVEKLAMAVDASLHVKGIKDKLKKCFNRTTGKDKKFQVKYFQSQFEDKDGNFPHGNLKNVVSLVTGLGSKNANKLFDDFAEYLAIRDKDFEKAEKKMKKMENNSIKKIFINQIEKQIEMYRDRKSELNTETLDEIEKISTIIKDISKEMDSIVCDFQQKDDQILNEIDKFTS